jgi:hypothetical protein
MKILQSKLLVFLTMVLALFAGCKDEDEGTVSEYIGNYVITSAEVAEAITIATVEMGIIQVPIGTDITAVIEAALLSAVSCSETTETYVELREDNSIYMTCEGDNELNAGTWVEVDATTLQLNLNSTAIPSSPIGFVLTVTDVALTETSLSGETSVPLPKEMIAAMISPLTLDPTTPVVISVVFAIEFEKK